VLPGSIPAAGPSIKTRPTIKKTPSVFLVVTHGVEKSNFYKDLQRLIDIDFKEIDSKNKTT
jgi:hypothetical protein